jgi:hypothetical protein
VAAVDDVREILATSADTFAAGATSLPCFFTTFDDEVQTDSFGGSKQLIRRAYALVCADDFAALKDDDQVTVTVEGVATLYSVLNTRLIQDGHMMQVNLQRVRA